MGCPKITYNYQEEGLEKSTVHFFGQLAQKRGQQKKCKNYMPFGLTFNSYSKPGTTDQRYKYNGKEEQKETGWHDYGMRMYMADIGRWGVIDMMAEQFKYSSSYAYSLNNPLRLIDLFGLAPFDPNKLREAINKAYKNISKKTSASPTCNYTIQDVMKTLTGTSVTGTANNMIDQMRKDKANWKKITISSESDLKNLQLRASQGYLIIGAKEAEKMGHVNVLRPGSGTDAGMWGKKYKADKTALFVPETLESNQPETRQSLNWGWGSDVDPFSIEFYEYIGNDEEDNNTYQGPQLREVVVTADRVGDGLKSLDSQIEGVSWQSIRPNSYGNTGRYNKPGRSRDQNYSDEFLKRYYGIEN
ncbi:MAG: RHS repeat-associated core domain-containing protein [Cyclobacteriaceae bacterium]